MCTTGKDRAVVEQVESSKFLGVHFTNKQAPTNMIKAHQDSREEGTTKPIPPQETEKIWHGSSYPHKVLQLQHREHPDWLHHCLVWQLLCLRPQGTTEGSAYGPVHHWGQASCHPGPLYQVVSKDGPKKFQTPATLVIDCSLLPHGKRYHRSTKSRSKRLLNIIYPQAISLLNI